MQEKNGPFALNSDVSTDFHKALVFVMFGIKLLLEHFRKMGEEKKHAYLSVKQ